ncbi:transcriptional regulator swi6 [Dinochytrium kinnereticum]|nr:transcriptional regulator swi6 [Dinochytrium kinnereticum]
MSHLFANSLPTPPLSSTASPPSPPPSNFSLPQSCTPLTLTNALSGAVEDETMMDLGDGVDPAFAWENENLKLDLSSLPSSTSESAAQGSSSVALGLGLDPAAGISEMFGSSMDPAGMMVAFSAPGPMGVSEQAPMAALDFSGIGMGPSSLVGGDAVSVVPGDSLHELLQLQSMALGPVTATTLSTTTVPSDHVMMFPQSATDSVTVQIVTYDEDEDDEQQGASPITFHKGGARKRSAVTSSNSSMMPSPTPLRKDIQSGVSMLLKSAPATVLEDDDDDDDDDDLDLDDDEEDEARRAARDRLSSFLQNGEAAMRLVEKSKRMDVDGSPVDVKSELGASSLFSSTLFSAQAGKDGIDVVVPSDHFAFFPEFIIPTKGFNVAYPDLGTHPPTLLKPTFIVALISIKFVNASTASSSHWVGHDGYPLGPGSSSGGTYSPISPTDPSNPLTTLDVTPLAPIRCVQVSPPPDPILPLDEVIEYSEVEEGSDDDGDATDGDGTGGSGSGAAGHYPPITYSRNCNVRPKVISTTAGAWKFSSSSPSQADGTKEGAAGGRRGSVSKRHHPYKDYALINSEGFGAEGYSSYLGPTGTAAPRGVGAGASRRTGSSGKRKTNGSNSATSSSTSSNSSKKNSTRTTLNSSSSAHLEFPGVGTDEPSSEVVAPAGPPVPPHNSSRPVPDSKHLFERTYSSVSVYEMTANGSAIMRRCTDGWINATHLLKVAGFLDKAKRTKVLEKEIHCGTHEKIQGGYGRYQGTWVPLERAKFLAAKFEVYDVLQEILER